MCSMPVSPNPLAREDDKFDQAILALLLNSDNPRPWSIQELVLEIGDRVIVQDTLSRLRGAGLAHQMADGFAFATRAAVRAAQLSG